MKEYKILEHSLYHIDRDEDRIEEDKLEKGKAEEYVQGIINKSVNADNVRYYKMISDKTEIICQINSLIISLINAKDSEIAATELNEIEASKISFIDKFIAQRLLRSEKKAQEKILKIKKEIRRGSLIQALVIDEDKNYSFIISKVEHVNILDKADWEKHTGLPLEKEILKTCVISYTNTGEINDIKLFDTNAVVAQYWYEGLLELEPLTSNEQNTKKSFSEIHKILVNNIKTKSQVDYGLLKNSLIGYYNQNVGFDFDDLKEKVFTNYKPQNEDAIDMKDVIRKLNSVSEKRFDKQFEIVPKVIRKNKITVYKINEEIDLTIKDSVENLKDIIQSEKVEENMYLKIKVDEETYRSFKYK